MRRGRTKSVPKLRAASRGETEREELVRLRRELEETRALLRDVREGGGAVLARRLASLEEERQVARGQAVEAALARGRAEAELRALRNALTGVSGLWGWLLRRAAQRVPGM